VLVAGRSELGPVASAPVTPFALQAFAMSAIEMTTMRENWVPENLLKSVRTAWAMDASISVVSKYYSRNINIMISISYVIYGPGALDNCVAILSYI
jgi:hypothetical protein